MERAHVHDLDKECERSNRNAETEGGVDDGTKTETK